MSRVIYLNALQALDAALRHGSLARAAEELGITAAAVGQRVKSLEAFTGTDLLLRGQAGVAPTPAASGVAEVLRRAFADLEQVALRLNLDRDRQLRIACDADLLSLWLEPRLDRFRNQYPAVKLAFVSESDPGPQDLRISFGVTGEVMIPDWLVPVSSPGNLFRVMRGDPAYPMEGMPLLHVVPGPGEVAELGWPDWFARHPLRRDGADRGFRYRRAADAASFAAANVGFALLPLTLVQALLADGRLVRLFADRPLMPARHGWCLEVSEGARGRPSPGVFIDWLRAEAEAYLNGLRDDPVCGDLAMELGPPRG